MHLIRHLPPGFCLCFLFLFEMVRGVHPGAPVIVPKRYTVHERVLYFSALRPVYGEAFALSNSLSSPDHGFAGLREIYFRTCLQVIRLHSQK